MGVHQDGNKAQQVPDTWHITDTDLPLFVSVRFRAVREHLKLGYRIRLVYLLLV